MVVFKVKPISYVIFFGSVLLGIGGMGNTVYTQQDGKSIVECKTQKRPFKYKLVEIGRGLNSSVLGMRVVLEQKYFTRDHMISLSRFIASKYCYEEEIGVTFFDDKAVASDPRAVVDKLTGTRDVPQLRGFLSYSKLKGTWKLGFSTVRGKPSDEVSIEFH